MQAHMDGYVHNCTHAHQGWFRNMPLNVFHYANKKSFSGPIIKEQSQAMNIAN